MREALTITERLQLGLAIRQIKRKSYRAAVVILDYGITCNRLAALSGQPVTYWRAAMDKLEDSNNGI